MLGIIVFLVLAPGAAYGGGVQSAVTAPGGIDRSNDTQEIVVTARRGETSVPTMTELDQADIAADGSDTIQELLDNLQPFIDSTGTRPVILINGKPAGFDTSILSYPTAALDRVGLLSPEVGPRYGARAGTPVINLVLKPKFSMLEAETGINAATAGGQHGGSIGVTRTSIRGDTRWNVRAQVGGQSSLLRSERNVPSLLENPVGIDQADFETLQPSSSNTSLSANFARPLGNLAASLTLNANWTDSEGLHGVLAVPLSGPGRNMIGPIESQTSLTSTRVLRSATRMQTLGASLTLTGMVRGVRTSLAATLSTSDADSRIDNAVYMEKFKQWVDGQDIEVSDHSPIRAAAVNFTRSNSASTNVNFRLSLQRSILDLPAGPIDWNISATAAQGSNVSIQADSGARITSPSTFVQSVGQLGVSLPISSRGSGFEALGDLALDFSAGYSTGRDGSAATSLGSSFSWAPFPSIQIRGSLDMSQNPSSSEQLHGPIVTTVNRIFDYARQTFAEPEWTMGGNPELEDGNQTSRLLSMTVRPLTSHQVSLGVAYRTSVSRNSAAEFPELIPAIEAAFPERVKRDTDGRLVAVDARPINLERQQYANLSANFSLRLGGTSPRRRSEAGPAALKDRVQSNISLSYQLRLQSELLIRRGLAVIDRLADSGASRHTGDLRIGVSRRAWGTSISTGWSSPSYVRLSGGLLKLTNPPLLNLSTFADPGRVLNLQRASWTRGTKLSLDVTNLLGDYRRATFPDGRAPQGYSRDEVDPLGRTVRLTFKKQF